MTHTQDSRTQNCLQKTPSCNKYTSSLFIIVQNRRIPIHRQSPRNRERQEAERGEARSRERKGKLSLSSSSLPFLARKLSVKLDPTQGLPPLALASRPSVVATIHVAGGHHRLPSTQPEPFRRRHIVYSTRVACVQLLTEGKP